MFASGFNINLLASQFLAHDGSFNEEPFLCVPLVEAILAHTFQNTPHYFTTLAISTLCLRKCIIEMFAFNNAEHSSKLVGTNILLSFLSHKRRVWRLYVGSWVETFNWRLLLHQAKFVLQHLLLISNFVFNYPNPSNCSKWSISV